MAAYSDKSSNDGGCWNWTGRVNAGGYGLIDKARRYKAPARTAHRTAYILANPGVEVAGLDVRHLCNNPACVNPDHLIIGTRADNVADRVAADRSASGSANGRAKLTDAQASAAKKMLDQGVSPSHIAVLANVTVRAVTLLRDGRNWRQVHNSKPRPLPP